jgi:Fe-S oxidoreductase
METRPTSTSTSTVAAAISASVLGISLAAGAIRDSKRILDDKLDQIEAAQVDLVVAVNPGGLRQLQTGLRRRRSRVRAVHLAELLADHDIQP